MECEHHQLHAYYIWKGQQIKGDYEGKMGLQHLFSIQLAAQIQGQDPRREEKAIP